MTEEKFIKLANETMSDGTETEDTGDSITWRMGEITYKREFHPNGMSASHTLTTNDGVGVLTIDDIPDKLYEKRKLSYKWIPSN